ncbi:MULTISPECIES: helix-turn-helix transcriptional regulator [unclassified Streptomyces]|uniref:helix-turn-helix domain-containing protein n=1 Tax=unclassified Streptomyces TaxID=2593676 RepID=UPI002E813040|nr:helix-turn-helix transcriptional regulator [Streptomyces sp. NBC_00589]WTI38499.1 helix-turn-helix domain-containing protein [Streptomyces sp. NBC_00775]WUB27822.1 helix-turn-helix domain-containing protein [Streptomyces sp. NBC_00589]
MADGADRSLADKLNELFANVRPDVGHEYSNEQVAAAIRGTGVTISQSYIWQLRKGIKSNPTLKHLEALAGFFGVPTAYFLDTETSNRVAEQLNVLAEAQARLADSSPEGDVRLMAMRAGQLSAERRKQVMDLLDVVYRLEQAEAEQQDTP